MGKIGTESRIDRTHLHPNIQESKTLLFPQQCVLRTKFVGATDVWNSKKDGFFQKIRRVEKRCYEFLELVIRTV
ncbi:hypothetical protein ACLOJK_013871 [Asimina triloba]